jgi:hypothetical protein
MSDNIFYKTILPILNSGEKGVYVTGIKVFNNLPQSIKNLSNGTKQFKLALKNYLHAHSFNSIDEYFNVNVKLSYISFKLKSFVPAN